ncbi:MAG: 2-dehydropantoate 2-reductase [Myxococcales bacterium]|nr:2-dehydropantoate 2-reductase [Myxococcales bacterium]
MRFGIFGTGGVGGYFGVRLAQVGHEVGFVARGRHLEAIRAEGLRLESPLGDAWLRDVEVSDEPAAISDVDVVLVAVKTWQLADALAGIRRMARPGAFVLPLLNGVEAAAELRRALGDEQVVEGCCRIISRLGEPGTIVHLGATPSIIFGEADGSRSERCQALLSAFECAGVQAELSLAIRVEMWRKLLFVASLGGVGAVTRAPIGAVRAVDETRRMLRQAMEEVAAVAAAHGAELPADAVAEALAFVDALPAAGTSSLQRDIAAGHRSELDAWSGDVVRLGRAQGIATPAHGAIFAALLPSELRARGELSF